MYIEYSYNLTTYIWSYLVVYFLQVVIVLWVWLAPKMRYVGVCVVYSSSVEVCVCELKMLKTRCVAYQCSKPNPKICWVCEYATEWYVCVREFVEMALNALCHPPRIKYSAPWSPPNPNPYIWAYEKAISKKKSVDIEVVGYAVLLPTCELIIHLVLLRFVYWLLIQLYLLHLGLCCCV